jgi:predicted small secreted protein
MKRVVPILFALAASALLSACRANLGNFFDIW